MKNHIKFEFYQCYGFNNKEDVLEVIKTIQDCGVVLAKHQKEHGEPPQTLPYIGSAREYVNEGYREVELVDGDGVPVHLRRGPNCLSGAGLIENVVSGLNQTFSFVFDMFGEKFNMVSGSLITRREDLDVFAGFFLEVAKAIYPILRPAIGIVDYSGGVPGTIFKEVSARKTKRIYWATFLGPDYVNKFGKEYFLNAPVWKKETLPDGGIFLQTNEHITKSSEISTLDEVRSYFSKIGVKFISWAHEKPRSW